MKINLTQTNEKVRNLLQGKGAWRMDTPNLVIRCFLSMVIPSSNPLLALKICALCGNIACHYSVPQFDTFCSFRHDTTHSCSLSKLWQSDAANCFPLQHLLWSEVLMGVSHKSQWNFLL
jgi:hypothetical protein